MIAMLRGRLALFREDYIVLDVQGVGYKVYTPVSAGMSLGQEVTLHTYLQVREDALVLYGFPLQEQLELFELLISVSGMGPKTALGVLNCMDAAHIRQAVLAEDLATLTRIPGVGKKTAQRLVLELKDKLKPGFGEIPAVISGQEGPAAEAVEALLSLGYTPAEAKSALSKGLEESAGAQDLETLIKLALKQTR